MCVTQSPTSLQMSHLLCLIDVKGALQTIGELDLQIRIPLNRKPRKILILVYANKVCWQHFEEKTRILKGKQVNFSFLFLLFLFLFDFIFISESTVFVSPPKNRGDRLTGSILGQRRSDLGGKDLKGPDRTTGASRIVSLSNPQSASTPVRIPGSGHPFVRT